MKVFLFKIVRKNPSLPLVTFLCVIDLIAISIKNDIANTPKKQIKYRIRVFNRVY
jgi:hypothetical protein